MTVLLLYMHQQFLCVGGKVYWSMGAQFDTIYAASKMIKIKFMNKSSDIRRYLYLL